MSLKFALKISLSKNLVSLFKFEIETFFKDVRNLFQFVTSGDKNLHPPEKFSADAHACCCFLATTAKVVSGLMASSRNASSNSLS